MSALTEEEMNELNELYNLESEVESVRECALIEADYFRRIIDKYGIDETLKVRVALWRKVAETRAERQTAGKAFIKFSSSIKKYNTLMEAYERTKKLKRGRPKKDE